MSALSPLAAFPHACVFVSQKITNSKMSFVAADATLDHHSAVRRFCNAAMQLDDIDHAKEKQERKDLKRENIGLRSILFDEMTRLNQTCIAVNNANDGKACYARIVERKKPVKITPEVVVQLLSVITLQQLVEQAQKDSEASLPSVLQACFVQLLKESGESTKSLQMLPSLQKGATGHSATPELRETAQRYGQTHQKLLSLQKQDREIRKPFSREKTNVESTVAEHLLKASDTGLQRIKIQRGTEASEYIIKRKESTRTKKPTTKSILPMVRESIKEVCDRLQISYDVSPHGLNTIKRDATLKEIEKKLKKRIDETTEQVTNARVTLTKTKAS